MCCQAPWERAVVHVGRVGVVVAGAFHEQVRLEVEDGL